MGGQNGRATGDGENFEEVAMGDANEDRARAAELPECDVIAITKTFRIRESRGVLTQAPRDSRPLGPSDLPVDRLAGARLSSSVERPLTFIGAPAGAPCGRSPPRRPDQDKLLVHDLLAVFDSPARARSLFTVPAAISSAVRAGRPRYSRPSLCVRTVALACHSTPSASAASEQPDSDGIPLPRHRRLHALWVRREVDIDVLVHPSLLHFAERD